MGGNPGNLRLPENLTWVARELEKVFATRPRDEWLDLLEAADCPAAPVHEPGAWLDHDQVRALGLRHAAVSDTGQEVVMPGPLVDLSLTPARVRRARGQLLAGDYPAAAAVAGQARQPRRQAAAAVARAAGSGAAAAAGGPARA